MPEQLKKDWGEASEAYDVLKAFVSDKDLTSHSEAQTRYDVIDRLLREVFYWQYGRVTVEERDVDNNGYTDYTLRLGDNTIIVEAKKVGAAFPSPTRRRKLKLSGSVLQSIEIAAAIQQAEKYAIAKSAQVVVVTNGMCWICFSMLERSADDYASIFFPFSSYDDAEALYNVLSEYAVESGSLQRLNNEAPKTEDRLLTVVRDADGRVDRNNIAVHITPALDKALYSDALLNNKEALEKCYVKTEARAKFDSLLGMHLSDPKPELVQPARRIKSHKPPTDLVAQISSPVLGYPPPVTLIIGPVGAGKSTYLHHFEQIAGESILSGLRAHWIYIDCELMGKTGDPKNFIYTKLREYLLGNHPNNPTDYKTLIEPAYAEEIAGLARGPLAPIFHDKQEYNRKVAEHINNDYERIEPYVDKLLKYLGTQVPCIVVIDNVDLYEDDKLETLVFSEGLALSKRVHSHVIVSLRDRTYVKHRADAAFDAYELRKLWLDPPPFRAILSARFTYAKKILNKKSSRISMENGIQLDVPDTSVFFDIVQRSILQGDAGDYIESVADLNLRKGMTLVNNLLTSGHIEADRALENYINGDTGYHFPFHEIFKGTMLGQWRYYKETRSEAINIYDSHLGSRALRLLRLHMLTHLVLAARTEESMEIEVKELGKLFSEIGATEVHVITGLKALQKYGLIRSIDSEEVDGSSRVVASKCGGYYRKVLSHKLAYLEACMHDTAIDDSAVWDQLAGLTTRIEHERFKPRSMQLRDERVKIFLKHLEDQERHSLEHFSNLRHLVTMPEINRIAMDELKRAIVSSQRHYGFAPVN